MCRRASSEMPGPLSDTVISTASRATADGTRITPTRPPGESASSALTHSARTATANCVLSATIVGLDAGSVRESSTPRAATCSANSRASPSAEPRCQPAQTPPSAGVRRASGRRSSRYRRRSACAWIEASIRRLSGSRSLASSVCGTGRNVRERIIDLVPRAVRQLLERVELRGFELRVELLNQLTQPLKFRRQGANRVRFASQRPTSAARW